MVVLFSALGFYNKKKLYIFTTFSFYLVTTIGHKNEFVRRVVDQLFYDHRFVDLFLYFLVGGLFYLFFDKIVWSYKYFSVCCLGILIALYFNIIPVFFPFCIPYLLLFLSQILPLKNLSQKIGDLSYGIYLYSSPFQLLIYFSGLYKLGFFFSFSFTIFLSVLAGYISWNFIEKKFLIRKN